VTTAEPLPAILDGLNPAQLAAVTHGDGPMLILAGPGSGKTRVITHRIAYLVRERRVPPWRILAVTFTNKAAKEMRERARRLLGDDAKDLAMGTFHSMCARWLRIDGKAIGISPDFTVYDDADQVALMKRIIEDLRVDPKRFQPRSVLSAISNAKGEMLTPAAYNGKVQSYFEEVVGRAFERYEQALSASSANRTRRWRSTPGATCTCLWTSSRTRTPPSTCWRGNWLRRTAISRLWVTPTRASIPGARPTSATCATSNATFRNTPRSCSNRTTARRARS
jgi:hypothetical protein